MLKNAEIISVIWYNKRVVIGGLEEQCHALENHKTTNPL